MLIPFALLASLAVAAYAPRSDSEMPMLASSFDTESIAQEAQAAPPPAQEPASAEKLGPFSWTYIDVAYIFFDADGYTSDPQGITIGGSLEIWKWFYLVAGYGYTTSEILNVDVDTNAFNVGLGGHVPVMDRLDVFATLSYVYTKSEASSVNISQDEDGYNIGGGLRYLFCEPFEAQAEVNYVDVGDADDTSFGLLGVWHFADHFGVRAGVSFSDDSTGFLAGLRWQL